MDVVADCMCTTTSMSVQGEYDGEEEDTIDVTYGFSKNKRPDLKQIVFGIGANHEGIPFFGQVLSDNHDDITWNGEVVEKIDTIISRNSSPKSSTWRIAPW